MNRSPIVRLALLLFALVSLASAPIASAQPSAPQAKVSATITPAGGDVKLPTLDVVLDIPVGFHAQSHTPLDENLIKLELKLGDAPKGVTFGAPVYPPGDVKTYPALGKISVYEGRVVVRVPLTIDLATAGAEISVAGKVMHQLCDDSACFQPKNAPFSAKATVAKLNVPSAAPNVAPTTKPATTQAAAETPMSPSISEIAPASSVAAPVATSVAAGPQWSVLTAFGAAALAGLLFNIMPCVLPVLPLKAMGFYEVAQHRRLQSIFYGLAFSAGVVAIFAVLAVLVIVLRVLSWGALFGYGWFVWSIVGLLVLMSIGLFGVFTVNLPVAAYSFTPRHDTYTGNFLWGGLTAILATPCTAPLLPLLLLWALAQPTFLGVSAMLMVGVGMSIPYLILSGFPELARRFPRTGPWPELFKQMMGFMILGTAVYFGAGRLIHGPEFFWLVCTVGAVASVYLMARTVQLSKNATPVVISSILAVATVGGTLWWSAKLNGLLAGPPTSSSGATATWTHYTTEAFNTARAGGTPVLVKFTANWCATCQFIEGTVFRDGNVLGALSDAKVKLIKVDLSDTGAPGSDLLLQLNPAGGIPLTALYTPGRDQPVVLSSVYSSQTLLDTLHEVVK